MNLLYPLKFKPLFVEKIWGGAKMKSALNIDFRPHKSIGEAWMLSGVAGHNTRVSNGFLKGNELNELVEVYMDDLLGGRVFEKHKEQFPILIKFIDANDWLSVQVHPDDVLAKKRNLPGGKTEMWYILDAAPGAELITGFNRKISREVYLRSLKEGKLRNILNFEPVSKGDVFYMPSGRIHALGPGILLAEIQQTSDTTYRIYDWDRVDDKGEPREMHTELALDAIDFEVPSSYRTDVTDAENKTVSLVDSPYFRTGKLSFTLPVSKDFSEVDSFVIYICTEGRCEIIWDHGRENIEKGEVVLVPAFIDKIALLPYPYCSLLEVIAI
jgi:mannose-6-phosphate isomerase